MDTTKQRESLARLLESVAAEIREGSAATVRENADMLFRMVRGGGDFDRLTAAIESAEYYECSLCGTDFHTERERHGRECREWQTERGE